VPNNTTVSQLLKTGSEPIRLSLAANYYAERPEGALQWGIRFTVTLLFK
jgi:hypothetical protein